MISTVQMFIHSVLIPFLIGCLTGAAVNLRRKWSYGIGFTALGAYATAVFAGATDVGLISSVFWVLAGLWSGFNTCASMRIVGFYHWFFALTSVAINMCVSSIIAHSVSVKLTPSSQAHPSMS